MSKTKIDLSDYSWNPVPGCSKISDGCRRCYAGAMAYRLKEMGQQKYRNGFKVTLHPKVLQEPINLKKRRMVFVCSMSDLFHDDVPDDFILDVFETMRKADHHNFKVLTKRSRRLNEMENKELLQWSDNIWAGVTVENSKYYYRIDDLVATNAKIKWLSIEPFIGEVDLKYWLDRRLINWVVVGGESGPGSKTVDANWVRRVKDKCTATSTPFFFEQWGSVNKKSREICWRAENGNNIQCD